MKKKGPEISLEFLNRFRKIPIKERLFFVQHLNVMLKAGISLAPALKTLKEQAENKKFKSLLTAVHQNVEKGSPFAKALEPYVNDFGELFINMIKAGEISGNLEKVLGEIFIQMKKDHDLISKIKGAMTYPLVILVAMTGMGIGMFIFIVPKIISIFTELETELPLATKILISFNNLVTEYALFFGSGIVIFLIILMRIIKTKKGKLVFHGILLKLPVFGTIIKKVNLARFARSLSSLLKTDISIIESFKITADNISNRPFRQALFDISEEIKKGEEIHKIMAKYNNFFPPIVIQMIAVGEETGSLDNILDELAIFYEDEVTQTMSNLPALIEPILMLLLGGAVGLMAVAIIMPMYSLSESF